VYAPRTPGLCGNFSDCGVKHVDWIQPYRRFNKTLRSVARVTASRGHVTNLRCLFPSSSVRTSHPSHACYTFIPSHEVRVCAILSSHIVYKDYCRLVCDAVSSGRSIPTFWGSVLPPFSGQKSNKKLCEELIAYFPWYDTGHIENDASNNSSIVACVFVTAVTFL
jgi:hypothetical protein